MSTISTLKLTSFPDSGVLLIKGFLYIEMNDTISSFFFLSNMRKVCEEKLRFLRRGKGKGRCDTLPCTAGWRVQSEGGSGGVVTLVCLCVTTVEGGGDNSGANPTTRSPTRLVLLPQPVLYGIGLM